MFYKITNATEEAVVKFDTGLSRAESALFARILKEEKEKEEGGCLDWAVGNALELMEAESGVSGAVVYDLFAGEFNV